MLTRGLWVVELVEKIGHKSKIMWYSVKVVDIDQGGCVELTRGRCERPCGEDWALMSWICIQPRPTTNQGIQPRPPPSVDIAIIADITFLYVNVMLSASQLHIFWLFTLYSVL